MRYLMLIAIALMASGCSTLQYIASDDNIWVRDSGNGTVFYCKANNSDKAAAPLCFPAAFVDRNTRSVSQ